jgi:outer membrane biosynthesis protein TonB
MNQIVMLTSLAGNGVDISAGDVCVCTEAEAERFIAARQARPFDAEADKSRRVKHLHPTEDCETPTQPKPKPKPKPKPRPKPKQANPKSKPKPKPSSKDNSKETDSGDEQTDEGSTSEAGEAEGQEAKA